MSVTPVKRIKIKKADGTYEFRPIGVDIENVSGIENKQNKLTSGEGISIINDVIFINYPDGDIGRY